MLDQGREGRIDVGQVGGVLALLLRSAHADEVHLAERARLGERGAEPQPAGRELFDEQLLEAGLVERHLAPLQPVDLGGVDVDAEHLVPEFAHGHRVRRAQIAGTDDNNLHDGEPYRPVSRDTIAQSWPISGIR